MRLHATLRPVVLQFQEHQALLGGSLFKMPFPGAALRDSESVGGRHSAEICMFPTDSLAKGWSKPELFECRLKQLGFSPMVNAWFWGAPPWAQRLLESVAHVRRRVECALCCAGLGLVIEKLFPAAAAAEWGERRAVHSVLTQLALEQHEPL